MKDFHPYTIKHLQIEAIQELSLPTENSFLIFWWEKIPLGHVWTEIGKKSISYPEFQKNIIDAISPSLDYYFSKQGIIDNWEKYFESRELKKITEVLQSYFDTATKESPLQDISVVICTRNRPQALEQCIQQLMNSSDKEFELIIVDNAPDDDSTRSVVEKFHGVRYIREERKGLDIARNTGAFNASHSIVAYTDDDVLVDEDWIKNLKQSFQDPMTMAVTGQVFPSELQTEAQYIFEKQWGFNKGYVPITFNHKYFLHHIKYGVPAWEIGAGANMAFRKEIFNLAGWFDERLDVGASGCSGDSEFWYRILAEGWNCNYVPYVFAYHQHRKTKEELNRQLFYYMRGHVSALLVQYENYGHKGNLKRLRKSLPIYYVQKLKHSIRKDKEETARIITQIKGCVSGWKFYRLHKHLRRQDMIDFDPSLNKEVNINDNALVSVVIPCYNHAHYLKEAIESVLHQTYPYTEIVVVDDGSADNTAEVCAQYPNVKYVRTERVGLSAARNIGVKHINGNFVVFLDADDFLCSDAIEVNLHYFSQFPKSAFVSGAHERIDEDGTPLHSPIPIQKLNDAYLALLEGNFIGMEATVMYRKEVFFSFHFDTQLKAAEDYDLNLRIARHFPTFSHKHPIAIYRIHTKNMSKNRKLMYESTMKVMKKQANLLQTEEEYRGFQKGIKNWGNTYALFSKWSIKKLTGHR
jgi:glycosyltransferase involved in cell wall biosynthesis